MPSSTPHLQTLVSHYLAANYPAVLEPFLHAAQISPPNTASPPSLDLRTLVQDYLSHRLAEEMRSVAMDDREAAPELARDGSWWGWRLRDMMEVEMTREERLSGVTRTVEGISASNLLTVGVARVPKREFDTGSAA